VTPFSDPHSVPFTYATSHSGIAVRYPGVVELTFLSERFIRSSDDTDPSTELIVCARLALPIDRAAQFSEALTKVLAEHWQAEDGTNKVVSSNQIGAGIVISALDHMIHRLLGHLGHLGSSDALNEIEKTTISEIKNAVIEGTDMSQEAPAVESAIETIKQLFNRWRGQ
jgi:hypothetical protein